MSKAKQLLEAIYKVYNPQEENKETARTYDSENLRNMFIGTIFGGDHQDTINNLRDCINKMSDDWVAEFLKVINGDVVEQVNESETIQETLNKLDEIKVTPKDVLDAKQRFEKQIEETTQLIERIRVYGSYEIQQRAYDNVTAQLKAMDKFLNDLYNETIGE